MAHDALGVCELDVPGGRVDVVDVREDELQRAAFCTEDQVDVVDVALEGGGELALCEHQHADHAHAEGEQHEAEGGRELLRSEVAPGEEEPIHDAVRSRRRG